jgi:hypothetical protein
MGNIIQIYCCKLYSGVIINIASYKEKYIFEPIDDASKYHKLPVRDVGYLVNRKFNDDKIKLLMFLMVDRGMPTMSFGENDAEEILELIQKYDIPFNDDLQALADVSNIRFPNRELLKNHILSILRPNIPKSARNT